MVKKGLTILYMLLVKTKLFNENTLSIILKEFNKLTIDEHYRKQCIISSRCIERFLELPNGIKLYSILDEIFTWDYTNSKHNFWSDIYETLRKYENTGSENIA